MQKKSHCVNGPVTGSLPASLARDQGGGCPMIHIMRPNNIKYDRTMGPNSDRLDMVRTECSQTQPRAGGFSSVFRLFFVFH